MYLTNEEKWIKPWNLFESKGALKYIKDGIKSHSDQLKKFNDDFSILFF